MEENYSDTEHIIAGRRKEKFSQRILILRSLIVVLLCFGSGLSIFAAITWNNHSNEILKALAMTGCVTILASIIGLIGSNKSLRNIDVIRTSKMKKYEGQEALLIFFYFNFLLFCAFLLFGTWCFFYQDDATAWLEAKYSDKESWERDFQGISLATVQNNIRLILTIAGVLSIIVGIINFACIYIMMKISMAFETIHTIIQVENLVVILISFLIIYSGSIAAGYYTVPQVSESEPEFLPQVFIFTGIAMTLVAYLGFFASKAENKALLISYTVFSAILLLNFIIFTILLNYGSESLQSSFEEKCNEVMPFFHKNFFKSFGCMNKYISNSTDPNYLTCPKDQIVSVWESNVGIDVYDQSDFYGCLNEQCCIAMISFVKGKFNFLAAFCIVAIFFNLVTIMTSFYMYKKIKKYHTLILSHRNDNTILAFMLIFTVSLGGFLAWKMPQGPQGMPQPVRSQVEIATDWTTYDLTVDRSIGLGSLNLEGWWNFDRISIFQNIDQSEETLHAELIIQSIPPNGEFRVQGDDTQIATIQNNIGRIVMKGTIADVNKTMRDLEFRPGCILDNHNALEFNLTITNPRQLQQISNETSLQGNSSSVPQSEYPIFRRYKIDLDLTNNGKNPQRKYRGKFVEINQSPTGSSDYFKDLSLRDQEVNATISLPFFKSCNPRVIPVDSHGIYEFNMTILNQSIPYTMKVQAQRKGYNQITFDYFVGGYPNAQKVEMGVYAFYPEIHDKSSNQNQQVQFDIAHNVTGRIIEAFNNKTFASDYSITVYEGYGEINKTQVAPYEKLDIYGSNGEYYTGFYELYDLLPGSYVAVAESTGFIKNFQRFYSMPSPFPKRMRALPLVPELFQGELALVLTWGYSPRDLDIHVEFIASPTLSCKCDFSQHQCGGVKYMTDTIAGGDKGSDVIKFDYIGNFQYLVYISLFKHKGSPKLTNHTQSDLSIAESQAQLKVFAPYYEWPVFIFDVPASPPSPNQQYWRVFCLDGSRGLKGIEPINSLTSSSPDVTLCQNYYGEPNFLKKETAENPQTDENSTDSIQASAISANP